MDTTEPRRGASEDSDPDYSDHSPASFHEAKQELPDDLPKSLDDRRSVPGFQQETEMYDAWQGECCVAEVFPRIDGWIHYSRACDFHQLLLLFLALD